MTDAFRGRWALFIDVGVLALIAIAQILLYFWVARDIQLALALNHRAPVIWSWWTHAFVHDHSVARDGHLWNNLQMYAVTVLPAWVLYVLTDQRRRFWLAVAFFLTVAPVVIAVTSHLVYPRFGMSLRFSRGFSGVVGALGGFLLGSTISAIEHRQPDSVAYFSLSTLLLFFFASVLAFIPVSQLPFLVLLLLTVVGTILGTRWGYVGTVVDFARWAQRNELLAVVIVVGAYVGVSSIVGSFPDNLTLGRSFVNVVAHGTGLILGLFTGLLVNGFQSPRSPTEN